MATFNKFNSFVEDLAEGIHNLGTDQITVALTNTAPVATNTVLANITQITYTNLSSRNVTTTSSAQTSGTYRYIAQDLTLTASGDGIGPFRYIVLYNSTAASGNLIGWYDNASSVTLNTSDTFTINFDNVNGVFSLA